MLTTKQRIIALYSLITLFLVGVAWIVITYFLAATLTIETGDVSNTIVLQENSPNPHPIDVPQGSKQAAVRLEAGNYTLTVQNTSTSSMQLINLGVGEHRTVILNPGILTSITSDITPVTTFGAGFITASSDQLTFIDRNNANFPLYTVDKANQVSLLDGSRSYQSINWADPSFGIGLVTKGTISSGLVKIENQTVSTITLPFSANQTNTSYAVAPNRTWYVSDGHTVYRANGDGSFTKIYSSDSTIEIGNASNQAIQITQQPKGAPRATSIAVIHIDGTKYQIAGEAYETAWSPSGKKLLTSGDTTGIFDDQLNPVGKLPRGNIVGPTWLDDNTILYIQGSDVWRYDTSSGSVTKAAVIDPLVGNFSGLRSAVTIATFMRSLTVKVMIRQLLIYTVSVCKINNRSVMLPSPRNYCSSCPTLTVPVRITL